MKKQYMKPAMRVVKIQQQHIICTSSGVQSLSNDEGFIFNIDSPLTLDDV